MSGIEYLLGYDAHEIRRLELQARIFAPFTERVLSASGMAAGMSVLDVGTGTGDVAIIAASLVGPSGSVLGVDREASVLDRARKRSSEADLTGLRFEQATLETLPASARFDAVIGRYVLMYQEDRADFLRCAAARVRPGGTLVLIETNFAEPDTSDACSGEQWSSPPVALYEEMIQRTRYAFRLSGARSTTGGNLVGLFRQAGLPEPSLLEETPMGGPSSSIVEWMCFSYQSVLPLLERHGIVRADEADPGTLVERIRDATFEARSQIQGAPLVGGWTRIPGGPQDQDSRVAENFDPLRGRARIPSGLHPADANPPINTMNLRI